MHDTAGNKYEWCEKKREKIVSIGGADRTISRMDSLKIPRMREDERSFPQNQTEQTLIEFKRFHRIIYRGWSRE